MSYFIKASDKNVAPKNCFVLALTSTKHVDKLHGLLFDFHYSERRSQFFFIHSFLSGYDLDPFSSSLEIHWFCDPISP